MNRLTSGRANGSTSSATNQSCESDKQSSGRQTNAGAASGNANSTDDRCCAATSYRANPATYCRVASFGARNLVPKPRLFSDAFGNLHIITNSEQYRANNEC